MSERLTADPDPDLPDDLLVDEARRHVGRPADVLGRWRAAVRRAWGRGGPDAARALAGRVLGVTADDRVLFAATAALRKGGPKVPGPNGVRLERLGRGERWDMCRALGRALREGTYRPGREKVVWVPKGPGRGARPVVLMDAQDRVVQKALGLVLRPLLDPYLDPLSFAGRPGRSRSRAAAVGAGLAEFGWSVWVAHDLRDAYRNVPVGRLTDAFRAVLPCPRLLAVLRRVLPAQSRRVGGVKQGGPLSPLALEVYLARHLDRRWRAAGLRVFLVRYADDLLLAARTPADAAAADALLRRLLRPTGMAVKAAAAEATTDLTAREADWLGFRFALAGGRARVRLGDGAVDRLGRRFALAHRYAEPARRAARALAGWVGQQGPSFASEDRADVLARARAAAAAQGFEELPGTAGLEAAWAAAGVRWEADRAAVAAEPGFRAEGPVAPPTPTAVIR